MGAFENTRETKNSDGVDVGKYVRFHQFRFNAPPEHEAGVIVSTPNENGRRARILAASSPGETLGTRMVLMWRQGEGIQGAPADVMVRIGSVAPGTSLDSVPNAGFRVEDLRPAVDPDDPLDFALPILLLLWLVRARGRPALARAARGAPGAGE